MTRFNVLFFYLLACFSSLSAQTLRGIPMVPMDTVTLFQSGEQGYGHYRIPSLVCTPKGSLLAFCEGRIKAGDAGNIDLLYRRSADGGKTWSAQQVIWDDGGNTCGNPCAVVDRETGVIWLFMTHNRGEDTESDIILKKSQESRTIWVSKSTDDGASWSVPRDITTHVKNPSWGWYATGPGTGIQIKNGPHRGRLVIPCDHSYDDTLGDVRGGPYEYGAHILYSDDHGKSWQLGGSITPKVNECQVVELADGNGTLLMNMRSYFGSHCRTQALSYDGGISWSPPKDIPELAEPLCQASILRYTWPGPHQRSCLVFLNPASTTTRHNLALRASYDEGKTWPLIRTLFPGPSAYSSMAVMPDGTLTCLYEAGQQSAYEKILFERVKLRY